MHRWVLMLLGALMVALPAGNNAHSSQGDSSAKTCIVTRYPAVIANSPGQARALGITYNQVLRLTDELARALGLPKVPIIIDCVHVQELVASYMTGAEGVPEGEYIVYREQWMTQVIGSNESQAIVLLGHELGHFLQKHFTERKHINRLQMETEADKVAGCAMAKMRRPFHVLTDVLSRIRGDKETIYYPTRQTSLRVAEEGFRACGGVLNPVTPVNIPPSPAPSTACGNYKVTGFTIVCDQLSWGPAPRDSPLGQKSFTVSSIQECASHCAPLRGCAGFAFDMSKSCYTFGPGSRPTGTGKGWLSAFK